LRPKLTQGVLLSEILSKDDLSPVAMEALEAEAGRRVEQPGEAGGEAMAMDRAGCHRALERIARHMEPKRAPQQHPGTPGTPAAVSFSLEVSSPTTPGSPKATPSAGCLSRAAHRLQEHKEGLVDAWHSAAEGLALVDAFHQVMEAMTSHESLKPISKSYTIAVQALLLAQEIEAAHLVVKRMKAAYPNLQATSRLLIQVYTAFQESVLSMDHDEDEANLRRVVRGGVRYKHLDPRKSGEDDKMNSDQRNWVCQASGGSARTAQASPSGPGSPR